MDQDFLLVGAQLVVRRHRRDVGHRHAPLVGHARQAGAEGDHARRRGQVRQLARARRVQRVHLQISFFSSNNTRNNFACYSA